MMDSVGIRDRDTRKGAVSSVQNETICGQPHPTVPSTPPPDPLKLPAGPKMRTAALASSVISSMPSRRFRAAALWPSPKLGVRIRIFLIVAIPAASLPRAYVNQVTGRLNVIHICGPGMAQSPFSVKTPIPFENTTEHENPLCSLPVIFDT